MWGASEVAILCVCESVLAEIKSWVCWCVVLCCECERKLISFLFPIVDALGFRQRELSLVRESPCLPHKKRRKEETQHHNTNTHGTAIFLFSCVMIARRHMGSRMKSSHTSPFCMRGWLKLGSLIYEYRPTPNTTASSPLSSFSAVLWRPPIEN